MYHFFTFNINSEKINKFLNQIKKKNILILCFEFIIELFKINQACSLAVFVPQKCLNRDSLCNIDYTSEPHMCKIIENVTCLSIYNKFVLYFNMFSILCFFILYIIEIKRELWLLDHFNYNENVNLNISDNDKKDNSNLFNKLLYCNKIYFNSYILISFVYITNFIVSGVLVLLLDFYLDMTSITVFITSFLLCSNKIIFGTYIAYTSYYENKPISYYAKYNLSYNEIKFEHTGKFVNQLYKYLHTVASSHDLSSFFKKTKIDKNIIADISAHDNIEMKIQKSISNSEIKSIKLSSVSPDTIELEEIYLKNDSFTIDNINLNRQQHSLSIQIDENFNQIIIKTPTHSDKIPFSSVKKIIKNYNTTNLLQHINNESSGSKINNIIMNENNIGTDILPSEESTNNRYAEDDNISNNNTNISSETDNLSSSDNNNLVNDNLVFEMPTKNNTRSI